MLAAAPAVSAPEPPGGIPPILPIVAITVVIAIAVIFLRWARRNRDD